MLTGKPFVWRGETGRWYAEDDSLEVNGKRFPVGDPVGSPVGYRSWREAYDAARNMVTG